jgi:uncharacterized membrane protein YfcA
LINVRGLLASPLGFLIGLSLGALGGGGSVLAVPALVYGAGQSPQQATATSLLVVGSTSLVALLPHARAGRVRWNTGAIFGVVGIGGSILGTRVNRALDPNVLLLLFSVLILVAAWRMMTACPSCTNAGTERALLTAGVSESDTIHRQGLATLVRRHVDVATALKVIVAGTAVGFMTGLFGVGGGFLIVPALTLWLGFTMPDAIGTSLLVIAINSAVAFLGRMGSGVAIDWPTTLPFAVSSFAGVLVGSSMSRRLHPEKLLRGFSVLLVVVALYVGVKAALAL